MSSSFSRGSQTEDTRKDLDGAPAQLPAANFDAENSSDEFEEEESPHQVSIFSRSSHIKSLGLYSDGEGLDFQSDLLVDLEAEDQTLDLQSEPSQAVERNESLPSRVFEYTRDSHEAWSEFKTEFSDVLRVSENEMESGQLHSQFQRHSDTEPGADRRHDLFIEMITALHDSRASNGLETDLAGTLERGGGEVESQTEILFSKPPSQSSPTRPRRQLLSLSTLETIHESEIDRMLEVVEKAGQNNTLSMGADSDAFSLTDSDAAASPSSPQKLVWGMKESSGSGNEQLMEQLEELSLVQSNGHAGFGETMMSGSSVSPRHEQVSTGASQRERESPTADQRRSRERPTVVIDLRPKNDSNVTSQERGASSQRCGSSGSEGEEEDDPYSWAQKRRQIKSHLEASASRFTPHTHTTSPHTHSTPPHTHSTSPHTHTTPPHTHSTSPHTHTTPPHTHSTSPHTHSTSPHISPSNTHHTPSSTHHTSSITITHHTPSTTNHTPSTLTHHAPSTSPPSHNLYQVHKVSTHHKKTTTHQKIERTKKHASTDNIATKSEHSKGTERSSEGDGILAEESESPHKSTEDGTSLDCSAKVVGRQDSKSSNSSTELTADSLAPQRQRSSDSLTLSSSYSDGDVTSSEGASGSGTSVAAQGGDTKGAGRTSGSVPSAGKKSNKHAKKSKKAKKKEQNVSKERSEKSQRRRAHVLQRIRRDSLNTSSDEENSLTPVIDIPSPVDSTFPAGSFSPVKECPGDLRDPERTKADLRRRIISKKPPAQFETPATDPVFHDDMSFGPQLLDSNPSLSCSGLLILPLMHHGLTTLPPPWSELDHIDTQVTLHCLLLTWLACQAAADSSDRDMQDKHRTSFSRSLELPFWIAGFQQTVLEGHPVILVAIQAKEDKPCEGSATDLIGEDESNEIENFLASSTVRTLLQPLLESESISGAVSPAILSSLDSLLSRPLSVLFAYQDDVSPFTSPVSFYWHSAYQPSSLPSSESVKTTNGITTTVCALSPSSLRNPYFVFSVYLRIFADSLDIAGMRLLFEAETGDMPFVISSSSETRTMPTLALALRGPNAVYRWIDVVGPDDSSLAKVTDPTSISALFGPALIQAVRSPYQSTAALAKWFGGRACLKTGTVFGMSDPRTKSERRKRQRVRFSESESEDNMISSPLPDVVFPPLISNSPRLIAQTYLKSFLVTSPSIPPSCYSTVLRSCSELGFDIFGAKRIRLNAKRAKVLEISSNFVSYFTPSSTPPSPAVLDSSTQPTLLGGVFVSSQAPPPLPSVIFVIGRENCSVHCTALKKLIVENLQVVLDSNEHIKAERGMLSSLNPDAITHLVPYSEEKLKAFGNFATAVCTGSSLPEEEDAGDGNSLREELCFVAVPGTSSLPACVELLDGICDVAHTTTSNSDSLGDQGKNKYASLCTEPPPTNERSDTFGKFELVGMRIVPQLSRFHAKKVCPLSAGEADYSQAIQLLSDAPASVFVLRGICCNKRVLRYIKQSQSSGRVRSLQQKLQVITSRNLSEGVHFSSLFFTGRDLFSDTMSRVLAPYLPQAWIHESDILQSFTSQQQALLSVLLLPLSQMKLTVKVLDKLSRAGFEFAGISALELSEDSERMSDGDKESCIAEAYIAVCLEKVNSVWHLEHLVLPFTKEGQGPSLKCSKDFNSAISDLRLYFPDGVFAQAIFKDYNIKALSEDNFHNLTLTKEYLRKRQSSSSYISPLLEKTLLLLPPSFLCRQKHDTHGFVHMLDLLTQSKFEICGMKMVLLSRSSVQELKFMLSLDIELEDLEGLPSLVVILERDNAASCFQLITKSTLQAFHGPIDVMNKLLSKIIAPNNTKQANQLFSFFHIETIM